MTWWLSFLLVLFVFRVCAQLVQAIYPVSWLPGFAAWHSETLPYPALVISQFLIIAAAVVFIRKIRASTRSTASRAGSVCQLLGLFYLALMLFRLIAGLSFAAGHSWLDALLPTLYHLVLAMFLISAGIELNRSAWHRLVPWLIYPATISSLLALHGLLLFRDVNLLIATYVPVTLGALAIITLEYLRPYRRAWLPQARDVVNDASFMVVVQILLPRLFSFFIAISVLETVQQSDLLAIVLWPVQWPVPAQVVLMTVTAEFFRYWLHRLSHNWKPLWQLHAVHHSPHKLYWMNVSRFHPLDKAIQFLFDTLPFILLGVGPEVLGLYFVFYSINGFFQHCNIDIRLGLLNYLISGPELHRWHHSMVIRESNHNYGNNLIIFDLVFGSWFLPRETTVGDLGLINRRYPLHFLAQLKSPFVHGLDKNL